MIYYRPALIHADAQACECLERYRNRSNTTVFYERTGFPVLGALYRDSPEAILPCNG